MTASPNQADVARVLNACFTLCACHLLRELSATGATQTVRLGRLIDMTTGLRRHREHATGLSGSQGLDPERRVDPDRGDLMPDPDRKPLPPHLVDMIRSLYGVELTASAACERTTNPQNEM